ncbi:MAG: hypothetical protein ACK4M1_01285 [Flavobacterium sp.]
MTIKTYYNFIFTVFLLINSSLYSQNKIEDFFDNSVGKENLPLNNGTFYFNTFKTLNTHQYYHTNKYSVGTLVYDNQYYNTVNLKYDSFRDVLVFKPFGESENFGIILISEKVLHFTINNKNFTNLSFITKDSLKNVKGYYEENLKGKDFTFYIKHKKDRREFIKNQVVYADFGIYNEFLIFKSNIYHPIKSKKDVTILFPIHKKEINTFYSDNSKLSKDNKTEFYEKLFRFIDHLTSIK